MLLLWSQFGSDWIVNTAKEKDIEAYFLRADSRDHIVMAANTKEILALLTTT